MAGNAAADDDKSRFGLFAATPDNLLRDMTTDRPDTTETPFTIDAGRVQVEMTAAGFARSHRDSIGTLTESAELAVTNIRIGLDASTEIGFVLRPYAKETTRTRHGAVREQVSGAGGIDVRMKFNLWGNDHFDRPGDSALGLLPVLSLPTERGNGISPSRVEGGLVVPFAVTLTERFSLGINAGAMRIYDDEAGRYETEALATASLAYAWNETFGTYYEIAGRVTRFDAEEAAVSLGTGFTYRLNGNVQLDAGINVGITRAADAINPFIGISSRF